MHCDYCAHMVSEYVRVDERGGIPVMHCELAYDDDWTDEELEAMERGECPHFKSPTQCERCVHLQEYWMEGCEGCEDYPEHDCNLDIEWTSELYEAVDMGECPYFECPRAEGSQ